MGVEPTPQGILAIMRMPSSLRSLDDKVLGRRSRKDGAGDADLDPAGDATTQAVERVRSSPREVSRPSARPGLPVPDSTNAVREVLGITYRLSALVFFLLAVTVALGIVFTLAPTNADNVIVRNVLSIAEGAAGPFKDVFDIADKPRRQLSVNYGFAAFVYAFVGYVVGRLPGGK